MVNESENGNVLRQMPEESSEEKPKGFIARAWAKFEKEYNERRDDFVPISKKEGWIIPETCWDFAFFLEDIQGQFIYDFKIKYEHFIDYHRWKKERLLKRLPRKRRKTSDYKIPEQDLASLQKGLIDHKFLFLNGENTGAKPFIAQLLPVLETKYGIPKSKILKQLSKAWKLGSDETKNYKPPKDKNKFKRNEGVIAKLLLNLKSSES